jgi:hypothetical protein
LLRAELVLRFGGNPANGTLRLAGTFVADEDLVDPPSQDVTVEVEAIGEGTIYSRTVAAGSIEANRAGNRFQYRDPRNAAKPQIGTLKIQRRAQDRSTHRLRLVVRGLDLGSFDPAMSGVAVRLRFGSTAVSDELDCATNAQGNFTLCVLR